jgi:uncharacterized protein (TIGR02246 family)
MTNGNGTESDEAQVRRLVEDRIQAVRARDVAAALASHAPDVAAFDVIDPLRYAGRDTIAQRLRAWLSTFEGPIGLEMRDLTVVAGDAVAFCHGLSHVSANTADGGRLDMWWRTTLCCQKVDGRWMVTHEHNSVPMNMDTGKASFDLKP